MANDLEQRAKSALDMVTRHGVNGSRVNQEDLKYGLEHEIFDQSAVDGAQLQYYEQEAKSALDMVTRHGVNGSRVNQEDLKYGLEHEIFDQSAVDGAQKEYEKTYK